MKKIITKKSETLKKLLFVFGVRYTFDFDQHYIVLWHTPQECVIFYYVNQRLRQQTTDGWFTASVSDAKPFCVPATKIIDFDLVFSLR